jgi:hypothetical protein
MDYAMGRQHATGVDAIKAVRAQGFTGRIVAMSSDPAANQAMIEAGANEQLQQKAMLRSYLVALGAGRLKSEGGAVGLPVLFLLAAIAAWVAGIGLLGAWGHEPRWSSSVDAPSGAVVKLGARIVPQGSPRSVFDGAAVPVEAVEIWAASKTAYQMIAGDTRWPTAAFDVATGGKRVRVETTRLTEWRLAPGPARRLRAPADVPQGENVAGGPGLGYVAKGRRVVEGQDLWIIALARGGEPLAFAASTITDAAHRASLGPDLVPVPARQVGGLALLGLGALLLAGVARA